MADLDSEPLSRTAPPHDGEARCRLCASADPQAHHDWCEAVSGLVCQSCCNRILLRDLGRLMSAAMGACTSDDEPMTCANCERGQQWIAGYVLSTLGHGTWVS
jgi:hypothetical protein